jgi:iron complex transport system permease protein
VAVIPALTVLLALALLANVGIGAVRIEPQQVFGILVSHVGIDLGIEFTAQQDAVLWNIRLPRVLLAAAGGAGLAAAGAAIQATFRNPLAEPGLVGVSSGAAVAVVALIVVGVAPLGMASQPIAAFAGGTLAVTGVYLFSRYEGRTDIVTLILTGIAVNATAGGIIGLLVYYASDAELRNIVFWQLGSLGGATWDTTLPVLAFMLAGTFALLRLGHALNLLVLGEAEARHLGLNVERVRVGVIALASLVTGALVSVAGIIGFVGLVVPHLLRLVIGPDHRLLLPASALLGASFLLGADLAARTVAQPAELPLGVVTALAGGPYFLFLLRRTRRKQGGWF